MLWFWSKSSSSSPLLHQQKRQFSVTTTEVPGTSRSSDALNLANRRRQLLSSPTTLTPNFSSTLIESGHGHLDEGDGVTESSSSGSGSRIDNEDNSTISEIPGLVLNPKYQMDKCTWSSVSSPGFVTRVVNKANHFPLKDYNGMSRSIRLPSGSPNPYRQIKSPATSTRFPSPIQNQNRNSLQNKSWLFSDQTASKRNRSIDDVTTYVRIAPLEPGKNYIPSPPPNSNEAVSPKGLGGIPSSSIASRYHTRLLPNTVSYESIRSSGPVSPPPSPPSNDVLNALANRKRGRSTTENMNSSSSEKMSRNSFVQTSPTTSSSEDLAKSATKRVKFYQMQPQEGVGGNSFVPLNVHPPHGEEHMSTESILEQMNQTEKRFLPPDENSSGKGHEKRARGVLSNVPGPSGSTVGPAPNSYRKRRVSNSSPSKLEADDPKEKAGRFCDCNECYQELAGSGISNSNDSHYKPTPKKVKESPGSSVPPPPSTSIDGKGPSGKTPSVLTKGRERTLCDKGIGTDTDWLNLSARTKSSKTPTGKHSYVVDLEKYRADKLKNIERFNRLLNLNPQKTKAEVVPQQTVTFAAAVSTSNGSNTVQPPSTAAETPFNTSMPASTTTSAPAFGIPPIISFGAPPQQPSVSSASGTVSSSMPFQFGQTESKSTDEPDGKSPVVTAESSLPSTAGLPTQSVTPSTGGFSFGSAPTPAVSSTAPATMGGFSFGAPIKTTAATTTPSSSITFGTPINPPQPENTSSSGDISTTTAPPATASAPATSGFSFGAISTSAPTTSAPPSAAPSTGMFQFGQAPKPAAEEAPKAQAPQPSLAFQFGQPAKPAESKPDSSFSIPNSGAGEPATTTTSQPSFPSSAFTFGAPTATTSAPSTAPAPTSGFSFGAPKTTTTSNAFGSGSMPPPAYTAPSGTPAPSAAPPPATTSGFSFGTPATSTPISSTGMFSFGQKPQQTTGQESQAPQGFGSISSQGAGSQGSATGGIFGSTQQQGASAAPNIGFSSLTSTASNASSGAPSSGTPAFTFGQPQQQQQPAPSSGFSFGSQSNSMSGGATSPPSTGGIFGMGNSATSPQQQQQQPAQNTAFSFGGSAPSTAPAASPFQFGQTQPQQQQQQQNQGGFSFAPQSSSPPSIFGSSPPASNSSFAVTPQISPPQNTGFSFGSQTQTPAAPATAFQFGQSQPQQQQQPQQGFNFAPQTNFMAGGASTQPSGGIFGSPPQQQQQQQQPNTGFSFGSPAPAPGPAFQFGQPQQQQQPAQGGFNFTPQTNFMAQAPGTNPPAMFNLGSANTSNTSYARRRETRNRRFR